MSRSADHVEYVDVLSIDPLFLEKQRSRYASRGIAYLTLLNGIAALVLLTSVAHLAPQVEDAKRVVDAMLVFGSGAADARRESTSRMSAFGSYADIQSISMDVR